MEIKINKDIREFNESIFFGLSLRQFIFSLLACVVAVVLYFCLKPFLGTEMLSWVCIAGALPFAILGFIKYNGMTADKFIIAVIKSEILTPKKLTFKAKNIYAETLKTTIDENFKKDIMKPVKNRNKKGKNLKIRKQRKGARKNENIEKNI